MKRHLLILEISQKQAYIFGSRRLKDNLIRSEEIRYVTSPEFIAGCCPAVFTKEGNLVYSGGGHTVLQFETREQAYEASKAITTTAMRRFPGMEMFSKICAYNEKRTTGDNLNALSAALEEKKALRLASFHRYSFGIDTVHRPALPPEPVPMWEPKSFCGWELTSDGEALAGEDGFLSIVHIDGNSMGNRVQNIYQREPDDWEECRKLLDLFSTEIDQHFHEAYDEMCRELAEKLPSLEWDTKSNCFPVRRIINAGDDICFVCAGRLGLACAESFLRHLRGKVNHADGLGYAACAGVCMVHKKYPFRAAYDISEQLCSNAKQFGTRYDPTGGISAIDWHIEFGQLKDSLNEIRADYRTDDGAQLELRPYAVSGADVPPIHTFTFFKTLLRQLHDKTANLPRSKVKSLRESLKQGEVETALALKSIGITHILQLGVEARTPDWLPHTIEHGTVPKEAFVTDQDVRRCLYFDAIEIMDHIVFWEEAEAK